MAALARMRPRGRGTIVQVGRATARLYGERGANVGLIARGQAGLEGAEVRDAVLPDVTAGEYGHDLHYFRRMCAAGAVDCLQADISRCGAITEWLRVAAVAASHGLQISGHCGPHLHAHAAAATPNLRHLEWFHDHVRIESLFFDGTLDPTGGAIRPDPAAPGLGLTLRTADAEPHPGQMSPVARTSGSPMGRSASSSTWHSPAGSACSTQTPGASSSAYSQPPCSRSSLAVSHEGRFGRGHDLGEAEGGQHGGSGGKAGLSSKRCN